MWYVLRLFVELDKFMARYQALPHKTLNTVQELVTLRQPFKEMYQRDLSMFFGYAFVKADPKAIGQVSEALRSAGIAEVLTSPGSQFLMPMSPEEVQWVHGLMQSKTEGHAQQGAKVRITRGAFEGLEGTVESVAGQTVKVLVPLRRRVTVAYCTPDSLEPA
jgi:transcription antitermination factor NusG